MVAFLTSIVSFKKNGIKGGKNNEEENARAFLCAAMAVTLVAGCGAPAADAGKDKGGDSKKEASEGIPKDEIK